MALVAQQQSVSDMVVLVPGFLPLSALSHAPKYFDDRFIESLGRALRPQHAHDVNFAIEVLDAQRPGDLGTRQDLLISDLSDLLDRPAYFGLRRLHLVGHGIGGVDVRLLLAERRIDGRAWSPNERRVRSLLRGAVSIAAPQHGTRLAAHPDVLGITQSLRRFVMQRAFDRELLALFASRLSDAETVDLVRGAASWPREALSMLRSVAAQKPLLREIRPEGMMAYRDALPALPNARFATVVTLAADHVEGAEPPRSGGALRRTARRLLEGFKRPTRPRRRQGGALFRALRRRTANVQWESDDARDVLGEQRSAEYVQAVLDRSGIGGGVPLIGHPRAVLPCPIDGTVSDGLVNTARQLLCPEDPRELLAVVVGDHLDVLGHYTPEAVAQPGHKGLVKSCSGFDYMQLRELCIVLAEHCVQASAEARAPAETPVAAIRA